MLNLTLCVLISHAVSRALYSMTLLKRNVVTTLGRDAELAKNKKGRHYPFVKPEMFFSKLII